MWVVRYQWQVADVFQEQRPHMGLAAETYQKRYIVRKEPPSCLHDTAGVCHEGSCLGLQLVLKLPEDLQRLVRHMPCYRQAFSIE